MRPVFSMTCRIRWLIVSLLPGSRCYPLCGTLGAQRASPMRLKLKIDRTGTVSLAFAYLALGTYPAHGFSVVEVDHIPRLTPPAEVIAAYSRRAVNVHAHGPYRVSWSHLLKLLHGS